MACLVCFTPLTRETTSVKLCVCKESHCVDCDRAHKLEVTYKGWPVLACFICKKQAPKSEVRVAMLKILSSEDCPTLPQGNLSMSQVRCFLEYPCLNGKLKIECTACPAVQRMPLFDNPNGFLHHIKQRHPEHLS